MPECLVLAYDDSPDARTALEVAGAMHPGWRATVVHVWVPALEPSTAFGASAPVSPPNLQTMETSEYERQARLIADDGVDRAGRVGLQGEPATVKGGSSSDVAAAILSVAADHHAELIVVGRRGLGRIRAAVLGSVSDALVREAPLPVLVVPGRDD
jgi:nucleotide-binding universal stress UspA family protein